MRRILTGLAMLAVPTLAFTAAVTLGTYLNSAGQPQSIQGVTLLNQDGTVATIGGGGGGGAVTAAAGSYSPGFSTDIGTLTDGAWSGSGNAGLVAVDKGIFTRLGLLSGTVATEGATVAGSGQQIAGRAADGTQHGACVTTLGVLCSPVAGTAQRVITKTSISASTNTTVCPTATTPVTTELLATSGSVGIGLNGQTLRQPRSGRLTPRRICRWPLPTPTTLLPVAATNAITAYSGTAQIVVCVQTIRQ
jgi:hypothetical protein